MADTTVFRSIKLSRLRELDIADVSQPLRDKIPHQIRGHNLAISLQILKSLNLAQRKSDRKRDQVLFTPTTQRRITPTRPCNALGDTGRPPSARKLPTKPRRGFYVVSGWELDVEGAEIGN